MPRLFLGFDCSTQSFTAIVIDYKNGEIIYKHSINYDDVLPYYETTNGVYISEDGKRVHSNPLMWVEAIEILLEDLKDNISLKNVKSLSGSGQQHGTVYLNDRFYLALNALNHRQNLTSQLKDCFSRTSSPIWMDSSTKKQCEEIRNNLGGAINVIRITGSDTFERFSGPQIRKFYQQEPLNYKKTKIIHVVSSFLASLFIGKNAPIDHGDGAGMNLMNISTKDWDEKALDATAPKLKEKLPPITSSNTVIGSISDYFVQKYGFSSGTKVIAWSGDNPNSLIGVGINSKDNLAISLGTSDTLFGYMDSLHLDVTGEGHVFGAPTGDYMSLICFKNGSLAREEIKDQFDLNWNQFSAVLNSTPPGNNGKILLPYFYPEIVPLVLNPRVYRFGLEKTDMEGNVRAVIESQFLSMKLHSSWMKNKPSTIHATGGASANRAILQVASDIFQSEVIMYDITDSAALGAVFRAIKAYHDDINKPLKWSSLIHPILEQHQSEIIHPRESLKELYEEMLVLYQKYEAYVLYGGEDPESFRQKFKSIYFD